MAVDDRCFLHVLLRCTGEHAAGLLEERRGRLHRSDRPLRRFQTLAAPLIGFFHSSVIVAVLLRPSFLELDPAFLVYPLLTLLLASSAARLSDRGHLRHRRKRYPQRLCRR